MSTRFHVDLLHPGWVARTWQEWFVGVKGPRRLMWFALGCVAVLLVILVVVILPIRVRTLADLNALPGLQSDLRARETDLGILRSNLQALSEEARRQVRWAELLTTLSQQIPRTFKLQLVESTRPSPAAPAGQQAASLPRPESVLRIDAVTPLRSGSPPLLEAAQFMAGLMRDPAVNKRFQLKSWEVKPGTLMASGGAQLLNIVIVLTERAP